MYQASNYVHYLAQLAMITLGTAFGGIALAMGGKKKDKEQMPPINAGSKDEEAFIQFVHPVSRNDS